MTSTGAVVDSPTPEEPPLAIETPTATPAPTVGGPAVAGVTPTPTTPPATSTPTPSPTPVPSPTPHTPPLPIPTPEGPPVDYHLVRPGETLGYLALRYGVDLDTLLEENDLADESAIIQIGQTLRIPVFTELAAPATPLLPDSEVVYGPAYTTFDVAAFLAEREGYLAGYREPVNGQTRSSAEIIESIARQYSVGPRLLLALLEFYGGWVDDPAPPAERLSAPLGPGNPVGGSLHRQLAWAADQLNEGYYVYKQNGTLALTLRDRKRVIVPWGLNAGTVAVQHFLALNADWETWQAQVSAGEFNRVYRRLFGDPFALAVEPVVPVDLRQPSLQLPWEAGQTFYYTGGPHAAFGSGSAWAAVDFGPPDVLGSCFYSREYLTTAAAGTVIFAENGQILLDLDNDGLVQTGWVLLYLHVAIDEDRVQVGGRLPAGSPLGYASCEGGIANSSHLHFARRYNGEWIAAGGPLPLELGGWRVKAGAGQYDGQIIKGDLVKTACECWDEEKNALFNE
ncbi:MAG: LysM peptidoglycan-binding domain-containing protein [Anaerolineae bacterium]